MNLVIVFAYLVCALTEFFHDSILNLVAFNFSHILLYKYTVDFFSLLC